MRRAWVATFVLGAGLVALATVLSCASGRRGPALDQVSPETRQRMHQVMVKIGKYYEQLQTSVNEGQYTRAAPQADAVAALGAFLAPHRDPGMPATYVALQAQFDEASRELAAAARLQSVQEVSRLFAEMRDTCRACHTAFHVPLDDPYRELGYTGKSAK